MQASLQGGMAGEGLLTATASNPRFVSSTRQGHREATQAAA